MYDKVVIENGRMLGFIPDCVPDWFVMSKMIEKLDAVF